MATLVGLIAAIACMIVGIIWNGSFSGLADFVDPAAVFITVGGTACSMVIGYPVKDILAMFQACRSAIKTRHTDPAQSIQQIIDLANVARRDGLLALENLLDDIPSPFLKKGITLIVDGSNSELVKSVMETEMYYISDRHDRICNMLNQGAAYAPTYGMAGTLIGLIQMLIHLDNLDGLGPSMSIALVTTFYGVLLANIFFTPFAKKLQSLSEAEALENEMLLEGILSIQDGDNPRVIRDKMEAFIPHKQAAFLEEQLRAHREAFLAGQPTE